MKKLLFVGLIGLAGMAASQATFAKNYVLEPTHTFPTWSTTHLGLSTFTGKFNKVSGRVKYEPDDSRLDIQAEIDAHAQVSGVERLDKHLQGTDFFNTEKFPTINFVSTSSKFVDQKPTEVTGNLTLLGVTKPVTLRVEKFGCREHPYMKREVCGGDFSTTIKRSEFGMNYGLGMIGDDVKIHLEVEAILEAPAGPR